MVVQVNQGECLVVGDVECEVVHGACLHVRDIVECLEVVGQVEGGVAGGVQIGLGQVQAVLEDVGHQFGVGVCLVEAETGVFVRVGGDGRRHELDACGQVVVDSSVDVEGVLVRVTEEGTRDDLLVTVDQRVDVVGPVLQAAVVRQVVVTVHVNHLTVLFSSSELLPQPHHLASRVCAVHPQVEVLVVAGLGVKGYHP